MLGALPTQSTSCPTGQAATGSSDSRAVWKAPGTPTSPHSLLSWSRWPGTCRAELRTGIPLHPTPTRT